MKRILAIAFHPITYFRFKRMQEWIVLLWASATMLKIEEPSVWDVDRIHETINRVYGAFHECPYMLDDTPEAKQRLFWTLFLSRFKRLEITREEAKMVLDFYNDMQGSLFQLIEKKGITDLKADMFTIVCQMDLMVKMFGNMI
jgi:hypothetical protein